MTRFRAFFYSKSFNITISVLLNIAFFICMTFFVGLEMYFLVCGTITLLFFLILLLKNSNSKINFILLLMSMSLPIVSISLLKYFTNIRGSKRLRNRWKELNNLQTGYTDEQNSEVLKTLSKKSSLINKTSRYLHATLNAPVFENNSVAFIHNAHKFYEEVSKSIKGAKKYIFIECNEMKDCTVWRNIFQQLKEKSFQGVEIKLLYDDYHSIGAFKDRKTFEKLYNHKIETMAFNPLRFGVGKISAHRNLNNTIIIDGEVAYTGQIGLDDKFVEAPITNNMPPQKLASSIYIGGDAVISLTKNFVINWNLFTNSDSLVLEKYLPKIQQKTRNKNYIQPFEINPLIKESVCKSIQNNLINCSAKSLWIVSPYLLIGSESKNSIIASARCGIDVNIIVSKNYKSKWQNNLSYTNYGSLVKEGVKIYTIDNTELCTQLILADNTNLLIGGGNIDSRKMYSPFQNGILIYSEEIAESALNYINSILPYCKQLTYKSLKRRKLVKKFKGQLLKVFSPIM